MLKMCQNGEYPRKKLAGLRDLKSPSDFEGVWIENRNLSIEEIIENVWKADKFFPLMSRNWHPGPRRFSSPLGIGDLNSRNRRMVW